METKIEDGALSTKLTTEARIRQTIDSLSDENKAEADRLRGELETLVEKIREARQAERVASEQLEDSVKKSQEARIAADEAYKELIAFGKNELDLDIAGPDDWSGIYY